MLKLSTAVFEAAYGTPDQLPPGSEPEVAFAGRSNVGKSTLINKVLNRKSIARVSSTPGKTATINFYKLAGARLVDLPGYGYAKVSRAEKSRFGRLLDAYFASGRPIALVVLLVDMRHSPTRDDVTMASFLREIGAPFIVALTKSDKLSKTARAARLAALPSEIGEAELIPFSALKNEGIEEIRARIEAAVSTPAERQETGER